MRALPPMVGFGSLQSSWCRVIGLYKRGRGWCFLMASLKIDAIEKQILECQSELNFLGPQYSPSKSLIISTGDISDIDGFYALAQYATTEADVLFIMNYPAYLGSGMNSSEDAKASGLGYEYDTSLYLKYSNILLKTARDDAAVEKFMAYSTLVNTFTAKGRTPAEILKYVLTALAFSMAKKVWDAVSNPLKGTLHFCIGGINEINPFSHRSLKNEAFVYASMVDYNLVAGKLSGLNPREAMTSDTRVIENGLDLLNNRTHIYIDFNGSMAFLDSFWEHRLCEVRSSIKGVFVLGGVLADEAPLTMPPLKGVLNRLSCATMNQLYAPSRTASFFSLMGSCGIPVYMISNNVVGDLAPAKTNRASSPWISFLSANGISIKVLNDMASLFYNSSYNPPVKAFDFYSALALTTFMRTSELPYTDKKLHFDDVYGVSLISSDAVWENVVTSYSDGMKRGARYKGNEQAFDSEAALLKELKPKSMDVKVLNFNGHPGKLEIIK
jgi:hypothetical protein